MSRPFSSKLHQGGLVYKPYSAVEKAAFEEQQVVIEEKEEPEKEASSKGSEKDELS